jgi:hypothetical protein
MLETWHLGLRKLTIVVLSQKVAIIWGTFLPHLWKANGKELSALEKIKPL